MAAFAQTEGASYCNPLKIPVVLSGNFGEVRSLRYHTGLDFKTEGEEGKEIVAVADGYVARIAMSPTGYGKVIYVSHPSLGTQSVYGHMSRFNPELAEYVENYQYNNKKFKVDLYPDKGRFTVKQGEIIGYSGNSGSSGGPHLHFEIRDLATSDPLSPIDVCGIEVADNIPPTIASITLVELDYTYGIAQHIVRKRYPVTTIGNGRYIIEERLKTSRDFYLAIEVIELKDGTTNIYGTTSLKLSDNDGERWGYNANRLSFSYGNALCGALLYPQTIQTRNDVFRTYISSSNTLKLYSKATKDGVVSLGEVFEPRDFTFTASDENGNEAMVTFTVESDSTQTPTITRPEGELIFADKFYRHKSSDIVIDFPLNCLQESAYVEFNATEKPEYPLSKVITFASEVAPFAKSATLAIKVSEDSNIDKSKMLVVYIEKDGRETSVGGIYRDGYMVATIKGGGSYVITYDVEAPKVAPLFAEGEERSNTVSFKISDNLSGIYSYNVYIDGVWTLFDYDAKSKTMTGKLNSSKIKRGGTHSCKAVVSDIKGNIATVETTFKW